MCLDVFRTPHQSSKKTAVLLGKALSMGPCFHDNGRVVDPIESCFDQWPRLLGTLDPSASPHSHHYWPVPDLPCP